jgi:hypothetical protein
LVLHVCSVPPSLVEDPTLNSVSLVEDPTLNSVSEEAANHGTADSAK